MKAVWHGMGTGGSLRGSIRAMATSSIALVFPLSLLAQAPNRLTLQDMLARIRSEHPVNQQALAEVNAAVARAASLSKLDNPTFLYEKVLLDRTYFMTQPLRWPWEFGPLRQLGAAQ